jgi:hypothetical protein
MYCIPLGFIAVTCFSIARVLLKEIPVQPRRDPRAISLEQGRRKVSFISFVLCYTSANVHEKNYHISNQTKMES